MALPPSVREHSIRLEKCIPKFNAVLKGTGLSGERIKQTVVNALAQTPTLWNADPTSVLNAAMTAAVLGLEVDNITGQAYITPFKGKAQLIPGYKGYITLAHNSGIALQGFVVRKNDIFNYSLGINPTLEHRPAAGGPSSRGEIEYVYATARSVNRPTLFQVLHIEVVHQRRAKSAGYKAFISGRSKSCVWETDYDVMCQKTAVRAMAGQLPLNVQRAAAIEAVHENGDYAHIDNVKAIQIEKETEEGTEEGTPNLIKDLGLEWDEVEGK